MADTKARGRKYEKPVLCPLGEMVKGVGGCNSGGIASGNCREGGTPTNKCTSGSDFIP